jgi:hypothetical protein
MGYTLLTLNPNNWVAKQLASTNTFTINDIDNINNGLPGNPVTIVNGNSATRLIHTFDSPQSLNRIVINMASSPNGCTSGVLSLSTDGENFISHTSIDDLGNGSNLIDITQPYNLIKYKTFQITFTTFDNETNFQIDFIFAYIPDNLDLYSSKDYNVEFDDALLDLEGWKNPRYEGSKLTGVRINQFNQGDISYGLNPVIERKTACIFLGKDIDEGIANDQDIPLAEIINHSYLTINKILFIDLDSDEVEIVSRENMSSTAFNRIISDNFPEGSTTIVKSLEEQADKLKTQHTVKFNRGQLMKVYSYVANEEGYEDGVFGGHEVWEHKGTNQPVLSGSGLFGYGQTIADSQSLFNTNSLLFTTLLPSELNFYEGNYSTATMGSTLTNITASISGSSTSGISIWDGENEAIEIDPTKISGGN